jgi:ribosomal protein S18 acetylase RimI-like enzyme
MVKEPVAAVRTAFPGLGFGGGAGGEGTMTGTALRDGAHAPGQQGKSAHDPRHGSMRIADSMDINLRTGTPADAADCGWICYEAFAAVASRHGYRTLFPTVEDGIGLMSWLLSAAGFYTVVAEVDGRVVGSGVLQEWDLTVAAIAVISVDPSVQGHGVGERLMRAMTKRASQGGFVAVRLVEEAYNRHSFSLYTKLGFEVREMLVRFSEQPKPSVVPGYRVRPANLEEAAECDELCIRVHGHHRGREFRHSINEGTARVVEHDRRICGYMTGLGGGWHVLGESNEDLKALMASGGEFGGNGFLVPARNIDLLVWCLAQGLRVAELHTLMGTGLYSEPRGAWLPSLAY